MNIEALKQLVRERIKGTRKGSEEPAAEHSIRVSEILARYGYPEEVVIAGLLHDILEDSPTTVTELKELGLSARVLDLLHLVTHDEALPEGDGRFVEMLGRIVQRGDTDALAIKAADIMDNLVGCVTLSPARRQNMRLTKAPFIRNISQGYIQKALWEALNEKIREAYAAEGVSLIKI